MRYRGLNVNVSGLGQAREADGTTNSTATSDDADKSVEAWHAISAKFVSSTSRAGANDGAFGATGTTSRVQDQAFDYIRIGGRPTNVGANTDVRIAGVSIWNIAGLSNADVLALKARLGLDDTESIPDPRTINADSGAIWEGAALHFWRLSDVDDLADLIGSADMVATSSGGAPATGVNLAAAPINPPYSDFERPTIASCSIATLIEGTNAVLTGTNHEVGGIDPTSLTIGGVAQTIVSATPTTTTFTPTIGTLLYGVSYPVVLSNNIPDTSDDNFSIAMIPAVGNGGTTKVAYAVITETPPVNPPSPNCIRISGTPDIDVGSQVRYKTLIGDVGGANTALPISDASVRDNGAVSAVEAAGPVFTLLASINNNDGEGWSTYALQTFVRAADEPLRIGSGVINESGNLGSVVTLHVGQQVSESLTSWDWTEEDDLPVWAVLDPDTGDIDVTHTVLGTHGPYTVRATGTLVHVDIEVTITTTQVELASRSGAIGGMGGFGKMGAR